MTVPGAAIAVPALAHRGGNGVNDSDTDGLVLRSFEVTSNPGLMLALGPEHPIVRVNAATEALLQLDRRQLVGRPCLAALKCIARIRSA